MSGHEVTMLKFLSICAVAGFASAALASAVSGQGQPPQGPPAQGQPPAAPPQYSAVLNVGDMAPDFALTGSDGKVHKLSDYRGRPVVIAWFPKAFTGG
jgi:cytochrome oxidase Cu insertion factor (SCO1/SenC/PrrC family)